ncbi:GON-4-like protein isoform X3 [Danio rerio]
MDQTRKRRLNNRKPGLSQCKVARAEEPEDISESRDVNVTEPAGSNFSSIRASSPQSDSTSQEQHAACTQTSEDDAENNLIITFDKEQAGTRGMGRRKGLRRKKDAINEVEAQQNEVEDEIQPEVEIDRELDRELENKSRQHNLTSANVRSIIHEVITNEHVVAMMKAAISETEPIPVFEPKMTRSKLKEVVEKGVQIHLCHFVDSWVCQSRKKVIPTWNISPIKKPTEAKKGPQFVDIPLEEEDSSDEEYRPDEEEEDETAEETLLESDLENSSSSPRVSRVQRSHSESEDGASRSRLNLCRSRHLTVAATPMGPPPPPDTSRAPPECSFLEKLHAVDEELAFGTDCMDSYQSLGGASGEESLISFRTRSKRPLRDVPLGRLEAELRAPDITPDMYEFGSAPEDREWTQWLQGLMISDMDNDEEGDDEDDPEYNFLADIDEPDVEDYRNDKAVRITKKEVNDLMEELFDAFQDELGGQDDEGHEEEEEKEEEESPLQEPPGILENIQYEDPLADVLKQRYRTVREQLAAVRKRKALLESKGVSVPPACPQRSSSPITSMTLNAAQRLQLQQQIQQHVQLLTQVNMLSSTVKGLETEASTSRQFLLELQMFGQRGEHNCGRAEHGFFTSIFNACNLQGAVSLLEELDQSLKGDPAVLSPCLPGCQFPASLAWLMATRSVFLYPELLPTIQLRPSKFKGPFTSAEDCLVVLGHKHLRGTLHPLQMTCRYLLATRSFISVKSHIRDACQKPFPSVIKTYFMAGKCPSMPLASKRVSPCDQRPPVEREQSLMPDWLSKNLKCIYKHVRTYNQASGNPQTTEATDPAGPGPHFCFPPGMRYPLSLPEDLAQTLEASALSAFKKKKDKTDKSAKPLKPPPSAEKLELVLNQLPAILPKTLSLSRPQPNPCLPGNRAITGPFILSRVPPVGSKQARAIATSPNISTTFKPSSSTSAPVKNAVETPMGISCSAAQRDIIITLPAAVTPELKSYPSGHITVNQTQIVTSNVVEPAVPRASNLIISFQPPQVANTFICPTPIINTNVQMPQNHISQRCGTLPKLLPKVSGGLAQVCPKPVNRFVLLPSGNVFANSSFGHQRAGQEQTLKQSSALKCKHVKLMRQQTSQDSLHSADRLKGDQSQMSFIQETPNDGFEETAEAELNDDDDDDDGGIVENEEEERGKIDSIEMSLTLSESSGSPMPSIDGEDAEMEMEKPEEQKEKEQEGCNRLFGDEETGGADNVSGVRLVPELQETMEKFLHLATKTVSEKEGRSNIKSKHQPSGSYWTQTERKTVLHNDASDHDPYRDAKDIAFAQAYLEKVYEVLHQVPGKVDEFLCILSDFVKNPESHTSLQLLMRLKPILEDWPELLQDFAAFLHPDQARECGLLAEQQAFERSRGFLRQLESTFGEQSYLYRKVVHILQGDQSQGLADLKEIKAEMALLLRDHTDLLEEFWEYFKQIYPQVQENVETNQVLEEKQPSQPSRNMLADKKLETDKTSIKHRRKTNKHAQMAEMRRNKVKNSSAMLDKDSEASLGDSQQSLFNATGSSVCAKNISHTSAGKKVVLWTREADRVILTTCQQRGAKQTTFHAIAAQLGNKTASEV